MRRQGNPMPCPVCKERLPRIAEKIQQHLRDAHGLTATQAELHRLAAPTYRASKDKPQLGPDAMDFLLPGGGFETNKNRH
jgi:hypothetical protein